MESYTGFGQYCRKERGLSIPVTEELLKASLWRLDPLNEACDVIICEMILRDNGIAIKSFSEREISEGIKTTSGIAEYSLDAQGLLLCVVGEDSYIEFAVGLIAFLVFIYGDYLFGDKRFVFKDVGGDSYMQTYP